MKLNKFIIKAIGIFFCLNLYGIENTNFTNYVKEDNPKTYYYYKKIFDEVESKIKESSLIKEEYSLKIKCYISSNGKLRYSILEQSKNGNYNKNVIIKKLEEIKKINFEREMKKASILNKELEYKELVFDLKMDLKNKWWTKNFLEW